MDAFTRTPRSSVHEATTGFSAVVVVGLLRTRRAHTHDCCTQFGSCSQARTCERVIDFERKKTTKCEQLSYGIAWLKTCSRLFGKSSRKTVSMHKTLREDTRTVVHRVRYAARRARHPPGGGKRVCNERRFRRAVALEPRDDLGQVQRPDYDTLINTRKNTYRRSSRVVRNHPLSGLHYLVVDLLFLIEYTFNGRARARARARAFSSGWKSELVVGAKRRAYNIFL